MHWIMGKSLFNTFCMMRELNLFHILLDISTWQTWQPSVLMLTRYKAALDEQQGNHHEITWSKKHQTVSPLEAAWSACFQLQATSFSDLGSQQIQNHPVPLPLPASLAPELSCCSVDSWRLVVGDLESRDWEVGTRWRTSGLTYVPCFSMEPVKFRPVTIQPN